jgi:hypothetical protein
VDGPDKFNPYGAKRRQAKQPGATEARALISVEAMRWFTRPVSPWPGPPERYPNWRYVYELWRRGVRQELWGKILGLGRAEHESESYVADANEVRVHADGPRKRGGDLREAIGRSSGGLTSNVILLTDALNFLCALS